MSERVQVAVIGGGPAGLAAALSAKKAGAGRVVILERDKGPGGILQQCIHNGFGLHYFGQELTGPEYAQRFVSQLEGTDIELFLDTMVLEVSKDRHITAVSAERGLIELQADAVVLAMGCRERTRGALLIPGTRPAGVFTAGCAQRLVNMEACLPGKRVVILGSGDIGLIMARRMVWEGAEVLMVCELMPYSSGLNRNIVQCLQDNDIPLYFNTTVTCIHGKERVEGVTIAQVDPATRKPLPETARYVACDTLLLSVGLIPENELTTPTGAQMDRVTSGAVVDEFRQTTVPGIFACGNVLHVHDLVDNVSREAEIAGEAAAKFALGQLPSGPRRRVLTSGGARYAVPQLVSEDCQELDLYFRVGAAFKPALVQVFQGDTLIKQQKKPVMTPGEMEKLYLRLEKGQGDLRLHVEQA